MAYRFLILSSLFHLLLADIVQYSGELYIDGQNARNIGMGGYSVSFCAGSNPAQLMFPHEPSIHFSHKNKYSSLSSVSSLSYLYSQMINGIEYPIYISLINRHVNDIPDTRSAKNLDGSINYSRIDYFSQQETGLAVASTYNINDLTLGLTVKPFYITLAEYKAWGISGDIGLLAPFIDKKIKAGCRIENIFSVNYWDTGKTESSVPLFMLGGQIQLRSILLGIDAGSQLIDNSTLNYHAGFEYIEQNQVIIFRGGISHNNSFSVGIGLVLNMCQVDYAYIHTLTTSPFKPSHILGLGINIDKLYDIKGKISP